MSLSLALLKQCETRFPDHDDRYNVIIALSISNRFSRQKLFKFFVQYCDLWVRRGYDTPIAKALLFKKMRDVVGGNVGMLLSGGAPLSEEAHVFIRTCLCVKVLQGYGLTETGAVACVSDEQDISTGK